jgi:hypothetical protein
VGRHAAHPAPPHPGHRHLRCREDDSGGDALGPSRDPPQRHRPQFVADATALAASDEWVTEWQYSVVRPLFLARTDLLVWLDLSRAAVMRQIVPRTLRRRWRRVELWNGNVEPPLYTILTDRDHILRWAWRTHPKTAARMEGVLASTDAPVVVRLRNRGEVTAWLDGPVAALAPAR